MTRLRQFKGGNVGQTWQAPRSVSGSRCTETLDADGAARGAEDGVLDFPLAAGWEHQRATGGNFAVDGNLGHRPAFLFIRRKLQNILTNSTDDLFVILDLAMFTARPLLGFLGTLGRDRSSGDPCSGAGEGGGRSSRR